MNTTKILRFPAVIVRTGLSRSSIYRQISQNTFPHQVRLGARTVGFLESEIDRWFDIQISRSQKVKNHSDLSISG